MAADSTAGLPLGRRPKTVLQCYQRADEDRLRKALASRRNGAPDPV